MMVTVQQIQAGFGNYFDAELAPQIAGIKKWAARAAVVTVAAKLPQMLEQYAGMVETAGFMKDGMVDIDRVRDLFLEQARITGPVREVFPVVGPITFTEHDIETLYRHIVGGV